MQDFKKTGYVLFLIFLSLKIFAHPLDISLTTLQYDNEYLSGTTYIHPYEISLLMDENNIPIDTLTEDRLQNILLPYYQSHFKIYGKNGLLSDINISIQNTQIHQILSSGVYVSFIVKTNADVFPLTFCVDLFIEYFTTQTNKLILLDLNGDLFPGSNEIYLTSKIREWSFDIENPDFSAYDDDLTDTDNDGLTDHFETLYGLNAKNPDTDEDGYTDNDEFTFGWDPFDPVLAPGQSKEVIRNSQITDYPPDESITEDTSVDDFESGANNVAKEDHEDQLTGKESLPEPKNLMKEHPVTDKNIPDSSFLEKTLLQMQNVFTDDFNPGGLFFLLISVFILGFMHATMPGHGKGILIAYLTEKNKKFSHALGFITTFTLTHLIDVIILAIGFTIFFSTVDTTSVTYILRIIGGIGLFLIALYLIIGGIKNLKGKDEDKEKIPVMKTKSAVLMGFLTGLAPCPFGWALLMMLLSMGRIEIVPLIILVFGLGIFVFLFLVSIGIFIVRYIAFDFFSVLNKYSRLVSGILLMVFAILFFSPKILF